MASKNVRFIYNKDKLIGCGRSINDDLWYSLLVAIIVEPTYQNQKIGIKIIQPLLESLKNHHWIILVSERGKEEFYEKLGFCELKSGFLLPQSDSQKETFCFSSTFIES